MPRRSCPGSTTASSSWERCCLASATTVTEPVEVKIEPATLAVTNAGLISNEKETVTASIPTAIKYQDENSLAHPNLFVDKAEAEERWFQRLIALRQERLMGSPVA
ncbi:UNVERIFIED_CONTAM: Serine/Arginine- protein 53 [Gekko kuhli]